MRHTAISLALLTTCLLASCDNRPGPKPVSPSGTGTPQGTAPTTPSQIASQAGATPGTASAPTTPTTPNAPTAPTPGEAMPQQLSGPVTIQGLAFTPPEAWTRNTPSSSMRVAEFVVPDASGDPAKACSLVFFMPFGGTIEANVQRWSGQVLDAQQKPATPKVETIDAAGLTITTVELVGTYLDGMPGGERTPRNDWMFRGALIPLGGGIASVRMTGPKDAMASHAQAWRDLLAGAKK